MKFFVDTADVAEIKELAATGLLDGVTTNPSLVAKAGRDFKEIVKEICARRAGSRFGRGGRDRLCRHDAGSRSAAEDRQERHDQSAADARRSQGVQSADGRRHDGQRHAVLFGKPGVACGEGRRNVRVAVHRASRRHRAQRHGRHSRDPRDLRQLSGSLDGHSRGFDPHGEPREGGGHDRRRRRDHSARAF